MQSPSFSNSGLTGPGEAWQIAVEPWWPIRPESQQVSTLAWIWADGEMQEIKTVVVLTEEQIRNWSEIDLPLMLPGGTC
ncbi:hypothetical protein JMJ56_27090 [Belnapia sp. T18]|uniref:Uncharacterized protein n=1 Tax=Belnapia arida TaxID=2804533 RepID=A0ABS1U9I4_9PROT|nr:hypothetical protein [Belnapia arida]MBL6081346.1 hypothetical protein [Belnapia arida]MBL6081659.1 hypothetical protein [Belnapia arida]